MPGGERLEAAALRDGRERPGGAALFALLFAGLSCFMLASPAFPLAPRLFDRLAPGVNAGVFTVAAGLAVVAAGAAALILAGRGRGPARLSPALAGVAGAWYAIALAAGFVFMPAFEVPAAAVAFGLVLGSGMGAAFYAWGCAALAAVGRVRSFGAVLGLLCLAMACATGVNMLLAGQDATVVAAVVAVAVVCGAGAPALVLALARPAADATDRATFGELVAMGVGASEERSRSAAALQLLLPVAVLLLYAASQVLSRSVEGNHMLESYSVLAAPVLAAVPLAVRDDSRRVAFALRALLPLFGVLVLGAAVIAPDALEASVVALGAQALCYAYASILLALVVYFALLRAASLLPLVALLAAGALSVVMMLPHATLTPASYAALPVFMAVLVATMCLLVATPSFGAWGGAFRLADAGRRDAAGGTALADAVQSACDAIADDFALSPREREILFYLGRGYGPRYLATLLPIKENTIRSHVRNIYAKLDVHTQPDLVALVDDYSRRA